MNQKIEEIQSRLGSFLTDLMPVAWNRICLYAECEEGHNSFWGCFQERKTDLIVTSEFFYQRYKNYNYTENQVQHQISDFLFALYQAYLAEYGRDKIWQTMTYVIEQDKKFRIDFGYDAPDMSLNGILKTRKNIVRQYFGTDYAYIEEKYPY